MSTDAALRAAVWAAPHDDLPRLVYADFLDETGEAANAVRAEFIRVQCALAGETLTPDRRAKLECRERALWEQHRRHFKRGLPPRVHNYPFRRGFPDPPLIDITGYRLLKDHAPLLPFAPLWRFAIRAANMNELIGLFGSDAAFRLSELRVENNRPAFFALTDGRRLNLTALHWGYSGVEAAGVRSLAASDWPHLHALALGSARMGDEGAAILAGSSLARRLRTLDLRSNGIGPAGMAAMRDSAAFVSLRDLDLSYSNEGDSLVAELARGAAWPSLKRLRLFGASLTPAAAEALAAWPGGRTLEHLDLQGNVMIGASGCRALVWSAHLTGLKSLSLFPSNRDRTEVLALLSERFGSVTPLDPQELFWRGGEG